MDITVWETAGKLPVEVPAVNVEVTVHATPEDTDAVPQLVIGNMVLSVPYSVPLIDILLPHPVGRVSMLILMVLAARMYPAQGAVNELDMV